jgi:hypothetical protein
MVLVLLAFVRVFVVVAAISDERDVVDITPFMLVVSIDVGVAKDVVLELMIFAVVVLITPFTLLVQV